jgi:carboxyl-terminal processing protease
MPDSLKFKTLITNRTVFGGGGIMPDFFVPLDTISNSDYYSDLLRGGFLNTFSYQFTDKNRKQLMKNFPSFDSFNNEFICDDKFMAAFFKYVEKEDASLEKNEEEYAISKTAIKLRLKAYLARNLWDTDEFYQVYNESNEILQRAVKIIQEKEYEKVNLDH